MAQLQQIGMRVSPNYAPRKTVGEGLANLIVNSANAVAKYKTIDEQRKNKIEAEEREQDANDLNFVRAKFYNAYTDKKFRSNEEARKFLEQDIMKDEEYVARFGNKSITESLRNHASIDSWNYASAKLVKEMGKTQEQIELEDQKRMQSEDTISYTNLVSNLSNKRTNDGYLNMSNQNKIDYIKEEIDQFKQSNTANNFGSNVYKAKSQELLNSLKKEYSEAIIARDKQIVETKKKDFLSSYIDNPDAVDLDDIDGTLLAMNEILPENSQIKKQDFFNDLAKNVVTDIVYNPNKYSGMTEKDFNKKFSFLSKMRNTETKAKINKAIRDISKQTKNSNIAKNSLNSNASTYNLLDEDQKKEANKQLNTSYSQNFVNIASKDKQVAAASEDKIQKHYAYAALNNIKIGYVENNSQSFNDLIDSTQFTEAPEAAYMAYSVITHAQKSGYTIREPEGVKSLDELQTVARLNNISLNSEDGFASAVRLRNEIKARKENFTLDTKQKKEVFDEVISYNDSVFRKDLSASAVADIQKLAIQNMIMGEEQDDAIENAYDTISKRFSYSGGTDLKDVGVHTEEDFNALKEVLKSERELDVDSIDRFGSSIIVKYDGASSEEFEEERFNLNDISAKMKIAKEQKQKQAETKKTEVKVEKIINENQDLTNGISNDIITDVKKGIAQIYTNNSDIIGSLESEDEGTKKDAITRIKDGFKSWSNRVNGTDFKLSTDPEYNVSSIKVDELISSTVEKIKSIEIDEKDIGAIIKRATDGFGGLQASELDVVTDEQIEEERVIETPEPYDLAKKEGRKEFQKQLGFTGKKVDGIVGDETRKAYVSLYAKSNLNAILSAEGGTNIPEGEMHRGAEVTGDLNVGVKQTTRYGVVIPYTKKEYVLDKEGKRKKDKKGNFITKEIKVSGFAKLQNETDEAHAMRYYNQKVLPELKQVKGIEKETTDVINALSKYVWNKGSLPSNFDLTDEAKTQEGMLDITTNAGKQMNGSVNRTIDEYNPIAEIKGWGKVTRIRTVEDPNDSTKFKVQYFNENGLLHDDGEYKPRHSQANKNYVANKEYDVTIDKNGKHLIDTSSKRDFQ